MFMMSDFTFADVKDAYRVLDEKIRDVEKEILQLQKEMLHYYKSQSEVIKKLNKMCEHDWFKIEPHQFSPLECKKCGLVVEKI